MPFQSYIQQLSFVSKLGLKDFGIPVDVLELTSAFRAGRVPAYNMRDVLRYFALKVYFAYTMRSETFATTEPMQAEPLRVVRRVFEVLTREQCCAVSGK